MSHVLLMYSYNADLLCQLLPTYWYISTVYRPTAAGPGTDIKPAIFMSY